MPRLMCACILHKLISVSQNQQRSVFHYACQSGHFSICSVSSPKASLHTTPYTNMPHDGPYDWSSALGSHKILVRMKSENFQYNALAEKEEY